MYVLCVCVTTVFLSLMYIINIIIHIYFLNFILITIFNNSNNFLFTILGLELTFYSGVFGTCVGQTQYFGSNAKSIQGLSGMFIGVGEIAGKSS